MTKIRRIALTLAASSAIGSLAVLSPLAAQAKTAEWLTTKAMDPCFGAPGSANIRVTHAGDTGKFTFKIIGNDGDFEFRIRYSYWDAKQKKTLFAKAKYDPAGTPTIYSNSLTKKDLVIYRADVIDPVAEQLVYTSDGAAACD